MTESEGADASGQVAGRDHLEIARRRFQEGLLDKQTVQHLSLAIRSREVHGENLGFALWMDGVCHKVLDQPSAQEPALDGAIQLLSEQDDISIAARSDLASLYFSQRRHDEAEPQLRKLLELRRHHPNAADWLVLLSACIVEQPDLTEQRVEEAAALADEAHALLTSDGPTEVITEYPFDRALLECLVIRATCWSLSENWSTRHRAIEQFEAAEAYGLERIGPRLSRHDLAPIYRGWARALHSVDLDEEARRVEEHGAEVIATE